MNENWTPIKGYEGLYEVSDFGRVKSLQRTTTIKNKRGETYTRRHKEKILAQTLDGRSNYLQVMLCKDGKGKKHLVHRLVANAFIKNPLSLQEVNHIDEDKTNNFVDNLEWCTHKYNNNYGSKRTSSRGEKNSQNKFSEELIKKVRLEFVAGDPEKGLTALSKKYGISRPHLCAILRGNRWGWLE